MINWDRVDELRREVGAEDFDEVVAIFLDEVETVLAQMRDTDDLAELRGQLHFLKGGALNLGFRALGALCDDLGPVGRPAAHAHVEDLVKIYSQSKAEFLARIAV